MYTHLNIIQEQNKQHIHKAQVRDHTQTTPQGEQRFKITTFHHRVQTSRRYFGLWSSMKAKPSYLLLSTHLANKFLCSNPFNLYPNQKLHVISLLRVVYINISTTEILDQPLRNGKLIIRNTLPCCGALPSLEAEKLTTCFFGQ